LGPKGPVAALTKITHRLNGLAGTIGFPTISASAATLEALVGRVGFGRRTFDATRARDLVDAMRAAFATDLASASTSPSAVSVASDSTTRRAADRVARTIRILLVDDHAIVRRGLKALLSHEFPAVFGEAGDAWGAVEQLQKHTWDVALFDITLPGKSGLDLLKDVKAEWPGLPVLILSGHMEDQFAVRALRAGAGGYITKASAPAELAGAVRRILAGGRYVSAALAEKLVVRVTRNLTEIPHETLSDREYDVMSRIALGMTSTEIGEDLSLSVKTISTYRARVLEKLRVRNNAAIVQYAIQTRPGVLSTSLSPSLSF